MVCSLPLRNLETEIRILPVWGLQATHLAETPFRITRSRNGLDRLDRQGKIPFLVTEETEFLSAILRKEKLRFKFRNQIWS